jgi:hypothetical protein
LADIAKDQNLELFYVSLVPLHCPSMRLAIQPIHWLWAKRTL